MAEEADYIILVCLLLLLSYGGVLWILWMCGVGMILSSLFFWVGRVILSGSKVILLVCKVVLPFSLLVGGMLLSLRLINMVGEVVISLILLWVVGMVLDFLHMLVGREVLLLLVSGVVLSFILLYASGRSGSPPTSVSSGPPQLPCFVSGRNGYPPPAPFVSGWSGPPQPPPVSGQSGSPSVSGRSGSPPLASVSRRIGPPQPSSSVSGRSGSPPTFSRRKDPPQSPLSVSRRSGSSKRSSSSRRSGPPPQYSPVSGRSGSPPLFVSGRSGSPPFVSRRSGPPWSPLDPSVCVQSSSPFLPLSDGVHNNLLPDQWSGPPPSPSALPIIYNAHGNLLSSTGAGIILTSVPQSQIVSKLMNLHCQFIPLLQDPQVFQNIEQQYGVKFNVTLPNGSTKPIVALSSTIASAMSGSYPLTIESISDYLSNSDAGGISWNFFDDHQFQPMSPTDSAEIEKLYQQFLHRPSRSQARRKLPYSRKIGEWNYSYDFDGMVQTNTETQKKREIKRIDLPALDLFFLCLSCQGLKGGVQASIASLHETLKGMIIKKTFGGCSTDIMEPIIELARSFCVKVDSSLNSILISGGSDYLTKVFLVLRQKKMSLESTPLSSFPPEWEPQTKNIILKFVPVSSFEGAKVVSAFKKTMNANVSKIERIQNKFLYTKYGLCKKRMHEKNNGRVNEKWLFHGSSRVPPETIYKSEHGFDFRHGAQGMWGRGAYFAVNAQYSGGSYAFNSPQGQQIFLAFVLTGDSIAMQSNRSLVTPPSKEDGSGDYDSVNGETGSSQIYIVYDHDKCYPAYLITF
ncbi:PREDICTED: uncharacterized protein LOC109582998 [Amphimedon queenslandica]|uniref:Poly [ADP-ribose] polymerase n=1 Tax=Amphimedon queenslandica TaxID=400682 RepID=A0AAN0JAA7_AMPQE|nr:PREDICTED: uncharacterized protein LOC109582998 [Amphimedon queenslandica]|eukprot:XP_019853671.1 PREDICTED: uncharacterized protein LOC109582998 [Amphimedon queenslandica]